MRTGNDDVGKGLTIDKAERPLTIASPSVAPQRLPSLGAMSQQGYSAHGNECYPQKLVHLVGHRGQHVSSDAWDRLRLKQAAHAGME